MHRTEAAVRYFAPRCSLRRHVVLLVCMVTAARAAFAQDWPQFLGPLRSGVYSGKGEPSLSSADGPRVLWKRTVGEGLSGPVVAKGRLILFHSVKNEDIVQCLDAVSGKVLWKYAYPANFRDDFGIGDGPRAAACIAGNFVFTHGAQGMVHCLDFKSGKKIWSSDTYRQFGITKGFFGAACSPLVDDGRLLLNIGGAKGAGVAAFDAQTGKVLWQAADDEASCASPITATINNRRHAVFFTRTGLVDTDLASGKVLHQMRWRARINASVNAATPLVVGDLIFLTSSYQTGAVLLRANGSDYSKVWSGDDQLSCHYSTPVHHDGFLYGLHGRHEAQPSLRCVELKSGKVAWSEPRYASASLILWGDKLLLMRENGELQLIAASSKKFERLASVKLLDPTVRAYPALAAGRFYVRNKDTLTCVDLLEKR